MPRRSTPRRARWQASVIACHEVGGRQGGTVSRCRSSAERGKNLARSVEWVSGVRCHCEQASRLESDMRVVISEFMSLDGIVQAPGGATEDVTGGFRHGGWSMKYFDPAVMGAVVEEFAERCEVLLQGRRTYHVSAEAWPRSGGFADWINAHRST